MRLPSWLQAHTLGLVDDIGLQRVVTSALADLRWARARYAYQVGVDWDRVVRQLNKDIKAANDFLPDDKQVWVQPITLSLIVKPVCYMQSFVSAHAGQTSSKSFCDQRMNALFALQSS